MEKEIWPECAFCSSKVRLCASEGGEGPTFCPTKTRGKAVKRALKKYQSKEMMRFAKAASLQEAECYAERTAKPFVRKPVKTRVEETIEFAKKMNYRKLGVAFCAGLFREANTFVNILKINGFDVVVSVCCKAGRIPKEFLGLTNDEKVRPGNYESMCNPIAQAEILNEAETDFNILMGLCVGHDALFLKNAKALTTVLITKDRVLGHNPVAALYGAKQYFERLMNPLK